MTQSSTNDANAPPPALASAQERQWAMFAHLSVLFGGIVMGAEGAIERAVGANEALGACEAATTGGQPLCVARTAGG